jgi:formylglycine-generating enzyme required for sulfatase activity/predicted Ser/Thr protein kinase
MEKLTHTLQSQDKLHGKYTIIEVLGKGGFGITYLAMHDSLNKKVAIKELFMSTPTKYCTRNETDGRTVNPHFGDFEVFKAKFLMEAKTLAKFAGKKGIVQISDTFEENNTSYFVMDYIDGKSLSMLVATQGTLSEKQTIEYGLQILYALKEVHKEGILHRDLKPDNLIITASDNQIVLIDFGIAREYTEDETQTQTAMLTVGYAPPEQKLLQARRGAYTDLYSVGAILYYCLTGQRPQTTDEIAMDGYVSAKDKNPAISEAMNALIDKAITKPTTGRFQSCEEMIAALKNLHSNAKPTEATAIHETVIEATVETPKKSFVENIYIAVSIPVLLVLGLELWQPWAKKAETDIQTSTTTETPTFNYEMVYVEGGSYQMGYDPNRDSEDKEYMDAAKPLHTVSVGSFYIGKYEVTQAQWREIMGDNPSEFKNCDNCPVENVSWIEIQNFLEKLNEKYPPANGKGAYRLPTEEEWEYAARGGNKSKGYKYAGSNSIGEVAWYNGNSNYQTHPVGQKSPNELGIYDMTGNAWEWTDSGWSDNYEKNRTSEYGVFRGGSWYRFDFDCRVAYRTGTYTTGKSYTIGFRLVSSP